VKTRSSYPNSSFGIWRGSDTSAGGSGSGYGMANQGVGTLPKGWGSIGSMGGEWEPSIWYMFALIVGEMVVFHLISRALR
jgi:hypothetical protein